uniref:Uncharacterized protein n=1 Tax=Arundo donax TaxID=35708 RepID=A0A0A9FFV5_ARUDO
MLPICMDTRPHMLQHNMVRQYFSVTLLQSGMLILMSLITMVEALTGLHIRDLQMPYVSSCF